MTGLSDRIRLRNEAKADVLPIEKPQRRKMGPKGLARTQMTRKPSKLRATPIGHASQSQKGKVLAEGARIHWATTEVVDPAHITPRSHGGCDEPDCVIGLPRSAHQDYDEGKLDILPYLTLDEQAHAVSHVGILGALKRTTGENYVPEREA